MKMCRSDNDVRLTDGQGYFVEQGPYTHHLKTAKEFKLVSPLNMKKVTQSLNSAMLLCSDQNLFIPQSSW